jgi:hypothetical protein
MYVGTVAIIQVVMEYMAHKEQGIREEEKRAAERTMQNGLASALHFPPTPVAQPHANPVDGTADGAHAVRGDSGQRTRFADLSLVTALGEQSGDGHEDRVEQLVQSVGEELQAIIRAKLRCAEPEPGLLRSQAGTRLQRVSCHS